MTYKSKTFRPKSALAQKCPIASPALGSTPSFPVKWSWRSISSSPRSAGGRTAAIKQELLFVFGEMKVGRAKWLEMSTWKLVIVHCCFQLLSFNKGFRMSCTMSRKQLKTPDSLASCKTKQNKKHGFVLRPVLNVLVRGWLSTEARVSS